LKTFDKIAQTGQKFFKYGSGKRGLQKPQERVVNVAFDDEGKPLQISWGSGTRHMDFRSILYIAYGHYTPLFYAHRDELDPSLCFSVVGKNQILDLQASSKNIAELWVKGLRRLINQSDETADQLAKEALEKK